MAKKPTYLGAHTVTGSSTYFSGWSAAKARRGGVGLLGMAPLPKEGAQYELLRPSDLQPPKSKPMKLKRRKKRTKTAASTREGTSGGCA